MRVWRLGLGRHNHVDGEGARLFGGRWNSVGVPVVYAASHLTLALLEQLVHFRADRMPREFRAFAIELPTGAPIEAVDALPPTGDAGLTQRRGDEWAASLRSAALIVPSIIVPPLPQPGDMLSEERNVILNPRHDSARAWRVTETSFRVDPRLRQAAPAG